MDMPSREESESLLALFHGICEQRGIPQHEKDIIWQAMAALCFEQVWRKQGAFYETIKLLFEKEK
jgi:hypothetical protein